MTESTSCRNQSIDLQNKSMDWFLYDRNLSPGSAKWISKWRGQETLEGTDGHHGWLTRKKIDF